MIVWSKDMKIKKSHLQRIIREELQRESGHYRRRRWRPDPGDPDTHDYRKDMGRVRGAVGNKYQRERERSRKSAEARTAETNWDWMDYVAERVWNEMYVVRQRYGANLEKEFHTYDEQGRPREVVLANLTPEQVHAEFNRPDSDQTIAAIELMKRGVPWSDDKEQGRQIIKNAIAAAGQSEPWGTRPYWEDYTIMRANQRRRSQRLPEV